MSDEEVASGCLCPVPFPALNFKNRENNYVNLRTGFRDPGTLCPKFGR
jgi:hypothetical protein